MGFRFIGEGAPELRGLPPQQRRIFFLHAARKSYGRGKTWLGLFLFVLIAGCSKSIAEYLYLVLDKNLFRPERTVAMLQAGISLIGWIILAKFQLDVIRSILKQEMAPNKASEDIVARAPNPQR